MISRDFWPNIGGIAAHVLGLSKALAAAGCTVSIIAPCPKHNQVQISVGDGCEVHWIESAFPRGKLSIAEFALKASLLGRRIAGRVDIVHWHDLWADPFIARFIDSSARVFTNHSSGFVRRSQHLGWNGLMRWWHPRPSIVIAPSSELKRLSMLAFPDAQCHFVPNGVDISTFKPVPKDPGLMTRLALSNKDFVVLIPRRLQDKNGVEYAIRAIPDLRRGIPGLKVLVAGSGKLQTYLKGLSRELGVDDVVQFLGPIPNAGMDAYYSVSDVTVVPSLIEATSISVLEAMASGKVVVGTNVGGIPELVEHDTTGFVVQPRSSNAIAAAVMRAYDHPSVRSKMELAARVRVTDHFSWQQIANRTLVLYSEAIQRSSYARHLSRDSVRAM